MYKMYCMPRLHGCRRAAMYRSPGAALQRTSVAYTDLGKSCVQEQLIAIDEQRY